MAERTTSAAIPAAFKKPAAADMTAASLVDIQRPIPSSNRLLTQGTLPAGRDILQTVVNPTVGTVPADRQIRPLSLKSQAMLAEGFANFKSEQQVSGKSTPLERETITAALREYMLPKEILENGGALVIGISPAQTEAFTAAARDGLFTPNVRTLASKGSDGSVQLDSFVTVTANTLRELTAAVTDHAATHHPDGAALARIAEIHPAEPADEHAGTVLTLLPVSADDSESRQPGKRKGRTAGIAALVAAAGIAAAACQPVNTEPGPGPVPTGPLHSVSEKVGHKLGKAAKTIYDGYGVKGVTVITPCEYITLINELFMFVGAATDKGLAAAAGNSSSANLNGIRLNRMLECIGTPPSSETPQPPVTAAQALPNELNDMGYRLVHTITGGDPKTTNIYTALDNSNGTQQVILEGESYHHGKWDFLVAIGDGDDHIKREQINGKTVPMVLGVNLPAAVTEYLIAEISSKDKHHVLGLGT